MKLCKDCKHFERDDTNVERYSRCRATPNPVTGRAERFCDILRRYHVDTCGPDGKWWEPADGMAGMPGPPPLVPWWKRLLQR